MLFEQRVYLIGGGNRFNRRGPIDLTEDEQAAVLRRTRRRAEILARKRYDDGEAALAAAGIVFEEIVRIWLSEQEGYYLDPRRHLMYTHVSGMELPVPASSEVDGIYVCNDGRPRVLIEIRLSVQGMYAVRHKERLILHKLAIARQRWGKVRPLLIFVAVGPEPVRSDPGWLLDGKRLRTNTVASACADTNVPRVVLPIGYLRDFAFERGWTIDGSMINCALKFARERWARRAARRNSARFGQQSSLSDDILPFGDIQAG